MGEDETKILENSPLLRRVLTSLENLESHIKTVETKIEQQNFNTKPIWERALAEIANVNRNLATLSRKIDVFNSDMLNVRAAQLENEERLNRLEAENQGGGMTTVN
jgi:seryl-tRNA synthetase